MSYKNDSGEYPYDELDKDYRKLAKEHEKLKEMLMEACDHLYKKEASRGTPISKALSNWYKKLDLQRTIDSAQAELNKMEKEDPNESI